MVKIEALFPSNQISNMDAQTTFQLTASTAASACSGASLAFWLLSVEARKQPAFHKKPVLLSQAVIGGVIIIGSIVSIVLAIRLASSNSGKLPAAENNPCIPNHHCRRHILVNPRNWERLSLAFARFK